MAYGKGKGKKNRSSDQRPKSFNRYNVHMGAIKITAVFSAEEIEALNRKWKNSRKHEEKTWEFMEEILLEACKENISKEVAALRNHYYDEKYDQVKLEEVGRHLKNWGESDECIQKMNDKEYREQQWWGLVLQVMGKKRKQQEAMKNSSEEKVHALEEEVEKLKAERQKRIDRDMKKANKEAERIRAESKKKRDLNFSPQPSRAPTESPERKPTKKRKKSSRDESSSSRSGQKYRYADTTPPKKKKEKKPKKDKDKKRKREASTESKSSATKVTEPEGRCTVCAGHEEDIPQCKKCGRGLNDGVRYKCGDCGHITETMPKDKIPAYCPHKDGQCSPQEWKEA